MSRPLGDQIHGSLTLRPWPWLARLSRAMRLPAPPSPSGLSTVVALAKPTYSLPARAIRLVHRSPVDRADGAVMQMPDSQRRSSAGTLSLV